MKRFVFASLIFLLSLSPLFSEETNSLSEEFNLDTAETNTEMMISESDMLNLFEMRKERLLEAATLRRSPLTAALLSGLYSGAGQFYNKDYSMGSLLFFAETADYLLIYGMMVKYNNDYGDTVSFDAISTADKIFIASAFSALLTLKVVSVVNAYRSSLEYNRELIEGLEGFRLVATPDEFQLNYGLRF